jgi:integrase/recombinase XerC
MGPTETQDGQMDNEDLSEEEKARWGWEVSPETTPAGELVPIVPELLPAIAGDDAGRRVDLVDLALAGLKATSKEGYRKELAAFDRWASPKLNLTYGGFLDLRSSAANAVLMAWISDMQLASLTPATIRRRIAALKRFVKGCRLIGQTDLVVEAILPKAEAYRDTAGPGLKGWKMMLERAELEITKSRTSRQKARALRNMAIFLLMHDRGLRRSEVAALDLGDVDMERCAVAVTGKGHSSKEWLTISTRAAEAIRKWLECRGVADGPLFLHITNGWNTGDGRLSDHSINDVVKGVAKRAGLSRTCTAHALRHQAITEALDRTKGNLRDVQDFSRHKDVRVLKTYDDRRTDAGGSVSELLGSEKRRR